MRFSTYMNGGVRTKTLNLFCVFSLVLNTEQIYRKCFEEKDSLVDR